MTNGTFTYKLTQNPAVVIRKEDGAWVPANNADYVAWLAAPHTPDPADPPPTPLTPAQLATAIANDPGPVGTFMRGLIQLLATRFGITPAQVVTAIVNAAS
jgi:hypothetical protein